MCFRHVTVVVGYVVFVKKPLETLLVKKKISVLCCGCGPFFSLLGTHVTLKAASKNHNFPELCGSCSCGSVCGSSLVEQAVTEQGPGSRIRKFLPKLKAATAAWLVFQLMVD